MKWLFFSYSLPANPSRARVYVWRTLKRLGAANFQSFWVLPFSNERVNALKDLMSEIEAYKGESVLIDGKVLEKTQEEQLRKAFAESRNEEYQELIKKCEDFFAELRTETEKENFTFAEAEENEEEYEKLKQWLRKIEKRDVMGAPLRKTAVEKIKDCEKMFEDFARKVYEHQKSN